MEALVVRFARCAVGPVDRGGAKRSCRRRAESLLDELVLGARSVRRDDRPSTRSFGAKDDGIGSRSGGRLGHELVDELVEVERQRLVRARLGRPPCARRPARRWPRSPPDDRRRDRARARAVAPIPAAIGARRGPRARRLPAQRTPRQSQSPSLLPAPPRLAHCIQRIPAWLRAGEQLLCYHLAACRSAHPCLPAHARIVYVRLEPDPYTVSQAIDLQ